MATSPETTGPGTTERLFVALWPDAATRAALAEVARREHDQSRDGRLVDPSRLHLTLVFLGDVEIGRRVCVERQLGTVSWAPITLHLDRLGWFARSRVLWAGSARPCEPMAALARQLGEQLAPCGFVPENRPYQAHITLARKVRRPPRSWGLAPIDCTFDELTLVRSVMDSNGSTYEVIGRWPAVNP